MLDVCLLDHRGAPESIAGGRRCCRRRPGRSGPAEPKKKELMPAVRIELTTFRSFKDSLKEAQDILY